MVTWRNQKSMDFADTGAALLYGVGDCLSTDTKPTDGIYNGSMLREMDTRKEYRFDAESGAWMESTSGAAATTEEVQEVLNDVG